MFFINQHFISMHYIVNRTEFTLFLTKDQWKRSSGLLVNGDLNDPIITTTKRIATTTSGENSSFKMIKSSFYFIYLFYLIFIF